ncbi:14629_t:CDS:2, partial [Racocetra persica]
LTLDEKKEVYVLLIKEQLIRTGRYKKLHFIVRCIFNQPCYMVRKTEVKEFNQILEKEPKEVIGFLNDLIDTISEVKESNEQKLNILLGAFENIINIQKDILEVFKKMVDE